MKRKDMDLGTLYAITRSHHNPRPGYVLDRGKNPGKVRARIYWSWSNQDDDYLNPTPDVLSPASIAKYDDCEVTTADVLEPWADYCARRKAEQAERLRVQNEAIAQAEVEKQALIDRVEALRDFVGPTDAWININDLDYMVKSDRVHDSRYSASQVIKLLEQLQDKHKRAVNHASALRDDDRHDAIQRQIDEADEALDREEMRAFRFQEALDWTLTEHGETLRRLS